MQSSPSIMARPLPTPLATGRYGPTARRHRGASGTGVTLGRHLAVLAVVLVAAFASRPARADGEAADACGTLLQLLYWLPPPTTERSLALEVLADSEWESGTGTILTSGNPAPRLGTELRLVIGIPHTGYELLLDGGWTAPVLGSRGAYRAGFGFDASWDLGGPAFYLLATDGAYATADGIPGGVAVLPEWRFGMGFRIPAFGGAIVAEGDLSALGWLGEAGGPIVGLRLGYSFGGSGAAPLPPCVGPDGLPHGGPCRAH